MDSVGAKHRNVLKRFERIKKLQDEDRWKDRTSIFGLPKIKSIKIKVKKTKEAPAEGEAGAPGATPAATTPTAAKTAAPAAKAAAPATKAAAPAAKAPAPAAKAEKGKK